MLLRACRSFSFCPICGTSSRRIPSRYLRKLGDLPWEKLPVTILLQTRKFFCVEPSCRGTIFTEQLPGTVARYSRRTSGYPKRWTGSRLLLEDKPELDWPVGLACWSAARRCCGRSAAEPGRRRSRLHGCLASMTGMAKRTPLRHDTVRSGEPQGDRSAA